MIDIEEVTIKNLEMFFNSHFKLVFQKTIVVNKIFIFIFKYKEEYFFFKNILNPKIKRYRKKDCKQLVLHNEDDFPARFSLNKKISYWYKNGLLHRDYDLPAIESENKKAWFWGGLPHRSGMKPSVINVHGHYYNKYGIEMHEDDLLKYTENIINSKNKTTITDSNGTIIILKNGVYHSFNNEPAINSDRVLAWFVNGILHNQKKPAFTYTYKKKNTQYWANQGIILNENEIEVLIMSNKILDF